MRTSMERAESRPRWRFDCCSREEVRRLIERIGPLLRCCCLGDGAGRLGLEAAYRLFSKSTRQYNACASLCQGGHQGHQVNVVEQGEL